MNPNQVNNEELVKRLKLCDAQTFSDLVDCMSPKIIGFLVDRYRLSKGDAEEVTSDVLLKVFNKLPAQFTFDEKLNYRLGYLLKPEHEIEKK